VSRRATVSTFVVAGLIVCLTLVFLIAPHASTAPDGLNRVAAQHGLDVGATRSPAAGGPLAGYQVRGAAHDGWSRGVAGGLGVAVTFAVSVAGTRLLATRRTRTSA
jgi:cobalt/nickel transport system permease protein